jgi:hypothetical protein
MRRVEVTELMSKYPQINRELNGTPFQISHAMRIGRQVGMKGASSGARHESGILIDGGPLSHACLDDIEGIPRTMALANSEPPKVKNM